MTITNSVTLGLWKNIHYHQKVWGFYIFEKNFLLTKDKKKKYSCEGKAELEFLASLL